MAEHTLQLTDLCAELQWSKIFGNSHPVELDLGAGDGGFALAYSQGHPEINLLAVERLLGRVRKMEKRAARQSLSNFRVLRLELSYTVRYLLPASSVSRAHLLFPDPWPKRRHWDRRLVQTEFVEALARALCPGGELRFTTDHESYFISAQAVLEKTGCLSSAPLWDYAADPLTDFQREFELEGRSIYRGRWIKPRDSINEVISTSRTF